MCTPPTACPGLVGTGRPRAEPERKYRFLRSERARLRHGVGGCGQRRARPRVNVQKEGYGDVVGGGRRSVQDARVCRTKLRVVHLTRSRRGRAEVAPRSRRGRARRWRRDRVDVAPRSRRDRAEIAHRPRRLLQAAIAAVRRCSHPPDYIATSSYHHITTPRDRSVRAKVRTPTCRQQSPQRAHPPRPHHTKARAPSPRGTRVTDGRRGCSRSAGRYSRICRSVDVIGDSDVRVGDVVVMMCRYVPTVPP